MSTRRSIICTSGENIFLHIYHEMLDDTIRMDVKLGIWICSQMKVNFLRFLYKRKYVKTS